MAEGIGRGISQKEVVVPLSPSPNDPVCVVGNPSSTAPPMS